MTATRSNPGLGDLARPWFGILIMACLGLASVELARANATGEGSPGPDADSCGLGSRDSGEASAPSAPFPVALPRASLLGARNDLPNPYSPGVHWGRLPDGRRFGAAIGLAASPDGTIW